jgi:hypothetical protein
MAHLDSDQLLRRSLIGGYRVADVEVLLAQLRLLVSQLDGGLERQRERLETVESERRELDRRLDEAQRRERAVAETAAELRRAQDDAVRSAEERAGAIVEEARLEAARIQREASARTESAHAQAEELRRLRDTLAATLRDVAREFESVAGRIDRLGEPPVRATPPEEEEEAAADADLFEQRIELEAGPFSDFVSLSAFERALRTLPKVADVYICRFEGDRATIDLTLQEPTHLLDDMAARLPYHVDVRSAVADRISLTVSSAA